MTYSKSSPLIKILGLLSAIIERTTYIQRAWSDHLGDAETYLPIEPKKVNAVLAETKYKVLAFYNDMNKTDLPAAETEFFYRLKDDCLDRLTSKFYLTAKVPKTPWKTKPIVATCGTIFHGISKCVDYRLQRLVPLIPSYIKNSFELKKKLENLGSLPAGTPLFTMDATAIYTNINTDRGLEVVEQFLEMFKK